MLVVNKIKEIPNYNGYFVDSNGNVFSKKRKREKRLAVNITTDGYPRVNIKNSKTNKKQSIKIARLVLFAFIGSCPDGFQCCHNDGNKMNSNLNNLRWDTRQANGLDSVKHGTCFFANNIGEKHPRSKLALKDVKKIRSLKNLYTIRILGKMFNTSHQNVSRILNNQSWRPVSA